MKIDKKNIANTLIIFNKVYSEFNKIIKTEQDLKDTINIWQDVFNEIDFDYEEANEDFIKASKLVISENQYIPTIAEISKKMKRLYIQRLRDNKDKTISELKEIRDNLNLHISNNIDDEIYYFNKLKEKYFKENIYELLKKEKEQQLSNMILNNPSAIKLSLLDLLKRILEEESINE